MTKNALKTKIRVGQISYTNCIPFYHNLQDAELLRAVPTEINEAMHRGLVDVAPVSSLEYLQHFKNYYLLPQIGIGARDFSGSVILFSREKIENLNGASIAVSRESLSSVTLLKILLKFKYKFDNTFESEPSKPEVMLRNYPAALVIGDDALFYHPKEFVYKYDLAELWWNWAEKPFCFAVWAVRKKFADQYPDEIASFWRQLKKNTEKNLMDIEALIKEATGLTFLDDRFPKVFGYLFNLNYGLDEEALSGLELFYRLAHRLGVSPKPGKPEFFAPVAR
jgi:chorismate dehydratase